MQAVPREVTLATGSKQELTVGDRSLDVELSSTAGRYLARRDKPLLAELEILFGCLVRKQVNFRDLTEDDEAIFISDKLSIIVRPVLFELCAKDESESHPPVVDMPVVDVSRLIPHHLTIDYVDGEWTGSFSFS
jgi:hypothetical protein